MSEIRVSIPHLDNVIYTVPRPRTYGQLRQAIAERGVSSCDEYLLFDNDNFEQQQPVSDDQIIGSDIETVYFKYLTIRLQDRGQIYTLEDVKASSAAQELLTKLEQKYQIKLDYVTLNGKKVDNRKSLQEQDIKHNTTIFGLIRVIIRDKDIESEISVNISEHEKVSLLKRLYESTAGRTLPKESALFIEIEGEDGAETIEKQLSDDGTIYDSGIKEDGTLILKTPAFSVRIREKDEKSPPVEIKIRDEYTIRQVKALYSKALSEDAKTELEGLVENDKLIWKNDQLDDDKKVFQYRITENGTLIVDREDVTSVKTAYMCADCGSLVLLNKNDIVRCRECGYRIVYKQRTSRPCQYLAR